MKTLAERIKDAQAALVAQKDLLTGAVQALETEPNDESLLIQVEELTGTIEKAASSLTALEKAEVALAAHAQPVIDLSANPAAQAPSIALDMHKHRVPDMKPGELLFKMAAAQVVAFKKSQSVDEVLKQYYPEMPALIEVNKHMDMMRKSAVNPAMTTSPTWAGALVQNDVQGYIETLKDVSVAAALATQSQMLNFGGFNSITIPRRVPTTGAYTEPAWVAEGAPIPLTSFNFNSMRIDRFKLGAITTLSNEIAERAMPDIEGILMEALRESHAEVLDNALLGVSAGLTNVRPSGLRDPATFTVTAPTAGGGEDSVRGDILALLTKMSGNKLGSKPVLIMNSMDRLAAGMMVSAMSETIFRDELASGTLMGLPVISSLNVPQHMLLLVDAQYLATAFDWPQFEVSQQATVVELNADGTAPTMAGPAGVSGTPGEVGPTDGVPVAGTTVATGYTARSMFQTYSTAIRMIAPTSWGLMQDNVVEGMTATTWT